MERGEGRGPEDCARNNVRSGQGEERNRVRCQDTEQEDVAQLPTWGHDHRHFVVHQEDRHHLSKMHFTKENLGNISSPNIPQIGDRAVNKSGLGAPPGSTNRTPSPEAKDAEESLQSKYQKYSQLAKQLSCYDGTN